MCLIGKLAQSWEGQPCSKTSRKPATRSGPYEFRY